MHQMIEDLKRQIVENEPQRELEKLNREDVTYALILEVLDGTIIQIRSAGARNDLRY